MHDLPNSAKTILIIKEHPADQQALAGLLEREGYSCLIAANGCEALRLLGKISCALLISDVQMTDMTGVELLTEVRDLYPNLAVMMTNHTTEHQRAISHISQTPRPASHSFDTEKLLIKISTTLHHRELDTTNKKYEHPPQHTVHQQNGELELARSESMNILSRASEFRDDETAQHNVRIGLYCEFLAEQIGLAKPHCKLIRQASPLHDIGKIGIPDKVLLKPGRLTDDEFAVIKSHCEIGRRILTETKSELLKLGRIIAYTHHEKFDGTGYPQGLKGKNIPLEGRITAICDVFDALTTRRVYKEPMDLKKAISTMEKESGRHFDPEILEHFLRHIDAIWEIRATHRDCALQGFRSSKHLGSTSQTTKHQAA